MNKTPMGDDAFSLKKIAIPAFGPTLFYGISNGAVLPVIALSARELGASMALSGLIVSLIGIGSLVSNIPAAMITNRYGERMSMIGAATFGLLALCLCLFSNHSALLALGVLMLGMAASVFMLARQSYLIEAVPMHLRARALSSLGGSMRIGVFIGPFAAAALMHFMGLAGAYCVAIVAMIGAGLISFIVPDLVLERRANITPSAKPSIVRIARSHMKVFFTLGVGILLVSAMRASRQVVIPLWADNLGIDPATTAVIYGLVASIDMLVFYPAGVLMDQHGRLAVALPSTLLMGFALLIIPLTGGLATFLIASMILGLGNGIGSGIIMTLAADASPVSGRTEFLGIWRLIADIGSSGGPVILSAMTAAVSLAAGIAVTGVLGFAAAAIFWYWVPREPISVQR